MVTHRRSWLRQRTDASPHTNYLFKFLKSITGALGFRCLSMHFRARQKRNFKLLFSFRQPPRFLFRGDQLVEPSSPRPLRGAVLKRHPLRGRRILLSRFWPSTPFEFLFSKCWRSVESASSQPVFQPAPAAKGAHITHRFQGVNTCRKLFFRAAFALAERRCA